MGDWRDARISASVGPGWEPLVDELYAKIIELEPDLKVDQVKEKFGGLRFYVTARTGSGSVSALIEEYEARALQTCEWCGATEGVTTEANKHGWLKTLCPEHRQAWDEEKRWDWEKK